MKLSISNIAWGKEYDKEMYECISNCGFDGLEIAPTRIIEDKQPYSHILEAKKIAEAIYEKYHLNISSMQSIWYGKQEKIFGSQEERKELLNYTKKAIDFASSINCTNLVFGCPKNRVINNLAKDYPIALEFFKMIEDYANKRDVVFAIEPNPTIYNTNFITTTIEAINLVKELDHSNIKVNLDLGTMIENKESIEILKGNINLINHVHISEPNLEYIQERRLHHEVIKILKEEKYNNYVSIEMKNQNNIQKVKEIIDYIVKII